jgi:hypothetical protein
MNGRHWNVSSKQIFSSTFLFNKETRDKMLQQGLEQLRASDRSPDKANIKHTIKFILILFISLIWCQMTEETTSKDH